MRVITVYEVGERRYSLVLVRGLQGNQIKAN